MTLTDSQRQSLSRLPALLLSWYGRAGRVLPWRSDPAPYRVWISEIMLQQTRVEAALPYFERFLSALPDVRALAVVPEDELMKLWEGLGYYSRARNLQKAAKLIVSEHGGRIPASYEALLSLPGIGEYTAGAVASIAFRIPVPAVDGNVLRVLSRVLSSDEDVTLPKTKPAFASLLGGVLPPDRPGDFNQALMDVGATVCLPNGAPRCLECPAREICLGFQDGSAPVLPVKSPKKPRRVEEKTVFVLVSPAGLALRRRPEKGLLAGLWELPHSDGALSEPEAAAVLAGWGIPAPRLVPLPAAKHIFTHVEWRMAGFRADCGPVPLPEGWAWASREARAAGYAVPNAFSAYLPEK